MLKHILDAHGGTLPDDIIVSFQNTGKEMPETLDFVRDCGERWGVEIVWLEWQRDAPKWRQVTYETASRNGEPFAELMATRSYLPNPVARFCTAELKIRAMQGYMGDHGFKGWVNVVGLRADEPHRVARLKTTNENRRGMDGRESPLAHAGVTKRDVARWWTEQNFDLALPNVNGTTPMGNCDLCYLKGASTISGIIAMRPELARWWIDQEALARGKIGVARAAFFRSDRPSYAQMLDAVERQEAFDFGDADALGDCYCTD